MTRDAITPGISGSAVAHWNDGDDHALLWYRPNAAGERDPASSLILRFKDRYADAISAIADHACAWLRDHETELRIRGVAYVVTAPRSAAKTPNVACERLAAALAAACPWLTHLPNALVRTESITPAHRGGTRSMDIHLKTVEYIGPRPTAPDVVTGLRCTSCDAEFADDRWLRLHLDSPRHRLAVGDPAAPGVLVLDDVTTSGSTFAAARHILRCEAGAGPVVALAAGRTTRDEASAQHPKRRDGWAVLFDLDGTLVDSLKLKSMRDARRWEEVHASFHLSHILPGTGAMLAQVHQLAATGVVTMAPRRYAQALLEHHGLEVRVLVGYEDVRRRKPHPDPILRAAELLGVAPDRTVYVGDEVRDMVAAHRAGSHAIAFGRDLIGRPEARTAAWHATDWAEVVRGVRRIVQG